MRKSTFIKHLQSLESDELRDELEVLYDKFKEVKSHYSMELGGEKDREIIFAKAKKEIISKYKTRSYRRPKRPRISKIKKVLAEVGKVSIFKEEMVDLYLFNCECALDFIENYQFHSDPLHNTIDDSFRKACILIVASMSKEDFMERCDAIIDKSFDVYEFLGHRIQGISNELLHE